MPLHLLAVIPARGSSHSEHDAKHGQGAVGVPVDSRYWYSETAGAAK